MRERERERESKDMSNRKYDGIQLKVFKQMLEDSFAEQIFPAMTNGVMNILGGRIYVLIL